MNQQDENRDCPACGTAMRRGVKNQTVSYGGHNLIYEQSGWYCVGCDEGVLEGADNAFHDAALRKVMAPAKGSAR